MYNLSREGRKTPTLLGLLERWAKSTDPVTPSVIHHCQKPLDSSVIFFGAVLLAHSCAVMIKFMIPTYFLHF